jgi:hypothetical protein
MRLFVLVMGLVWSAFASSAPVWTVQSLEFKPGMNQHFIAGLNAFMATDLGKQAPGGVALNWVAVNGADRATHGMVMSFPSMKAFQDWNQTFWLDPKYAADRLVWGDVWQSSVQSVSERMMTNLQTWGDPAADNRYTEWVPLYTTRIGDVVQAMDDFLKTPGGKKFKGRVSVAQCVFCGESNMNAALVVSYSDMAEMDAWVDARSSSPDFNKWVSRMSEISTFVGNSLVVNLQRFE